ncbi:hypothetical protein GCM10011374_32980 [Kocuria dechangensis]|uniref:Uncharacterized protein n=1 Tax=Kocuria dechangensis TaxID=1176249 RepID=A0A917LY04_9MICC|nr:DUF6454 family protein [Kocuria dechangensis]GGG66311.1 hypothetical protein GCM10011374_32980 [Kocuria dechangensis]
MRSRILRGATVAGLSTALLLPTGTAAASQGGADRLDLEAQAVAQLTRSTQWEQQARIPLDFDTFHPQGMTLVGEHIFISSVEIIEPTQKHPAPVDGTDRTAGRGQGHVFVVTREGELVKDIELGEGDVYHPGGIDFDGESVWVPVAEYRPDSRSIVYSIDPETFEVTEQFRYDDHVGGVVRDERTCRIHGVSWGSRDLFTWSRTGRIQDVVANESHMVDHQDCEYSGGVTQICTGVTNLATPEGGTYELGGIALLDLKTDRVLHELPVQEFSTAGHSVTRNPVAFEAEGDTLRMFAAPDDGEEANGTELLVYAARP